MHACMHPPIHTSTCPLWLPFIKNLWNGCLTLFFFLSSSLLNTRTHTHTLHMYICRLFMYTHQQLQEEMKNSGTQLLGQEWESVPQRLSGISFHLVTVTSITNSTFCAQWLSIFIYANIWMVGGWLALMHGFHLYI